MKSQNTFTGAKMNKDVDERYVPKNEYRDAVNMDIQSNNTDGNAGVMKVARKPKEILKTNKIEIGLKAIGGYIFSFYVYKKYGVWRTVLYRTSEESRLSTLLFDYAIGHTDATVVNGIDLVDNKLLYFNDGVNQPMKVNVDRLLEDPDYYLVNNTLDVESIYAAKRPPLFEPEIVSVVVDENADPTPPFQIAAQYIYKDGEESTLSFIASTDINTPPVETIKEAYAFRQEISGGTYDTISQSNGLIYNTDGTSFKSNHSGEVCIGNVIINSKHCIVRKSSMLSSDYNKIYEFSDSTQIIGIDVSGSGEYGAFCTDSLDIYISTDYCFSFTKFPAESKGWQAKCTNNGDIICKGITAYIENDYREILRYSKSGILKSKATLPDFSYFLDVSSDGGIVVCDDMVSVNGGIYFEKCKTQTIIKNNNQYSLSKIMIPDNEVELIFLYSNYHVDVNPYLNSIISIRSEYFKSPIIAAPDVSEIQEYPLEEYKAFTTNESKNMKWFNEYSYSSYNGYQLRVKFNNTDLSYGERVINQTGSTLHYLNSFKKIDSTPVSGKVLLNGTIASSNEYKYIEFDISGLLNGFYINALSHGDDTCLIAYYGQSMNFLGYSGVGGVGYSVVPGIHSSGLDAQIPLNTVFVRICSYMNKPYSKLSATVRDDVYGKTLLYSPRFNKSNTYTSLRSTIKEANVSIPLISTEKEIDKVRVLYRNSGDNNWRVNSVKNSTEAINGKITSKILNVINDKIYTGNSSILFSYNPIKSKTQSLISGAVVYSNIIDTYPGVNASYNIEEVDRSVSYPSEISSSVKSFKSGVNYKFSVFYYDNFNRGISIDPENIYISKIGSNNGIKSRGIKITISHSAPNWATRFKIIKQDQSFKYDPIQSLSYPLVADNGSINLLYSDTEPTYTPKEGDIIELASSFGNKVPSSNIRFDVISFKKQLAAGGRPEGWYITIKQPSGSTTEITEQSDGGGFYTIDKVLHASSGFKYYSISITPDVKSIKYRIPEEGTGLIYSEHCSILCTDQNGNVILSRVVPYDKFPREIISGDFIIPTSCNNVIFSIPTTIESDGDVYIKTIKYNTPGYSTSFVSNKVDIFSQSSFYLIRSGVSTDTGLFVECPRTYTCENGLHKSLYTGDTSQTSSQDAIIFVDDFDVVWDEFSTGLEIEKKEFYGGALISHRGRASYFSDKIQSKRNTTCVYSDKYIYETGYNGLSLFPPANYKDLPIEKGEIAATYADDDQLLVLQKDQVGIILIDKQILTTATGGGDVSSVNNFLAQYVPIPGIYGCVSPLSLSSRGEVKFFVDKTRGLIIATSGNQIKELTANCENELRERIKNSTKITSGYDPEFEGYIICFDDFVYRYSQRADGYDGKFTFSPKFLSNSGSKLYCQKEGSLYSYNEGDYYEDASVTIVNNETTSSIKSYDAISIESDTSWRADIFTSKQATNITEAEMEQGEGIWHAAIPMDTTVGNKNTFATIPIGKVLSVSGDETKIVILSHPISRIDVQKGMAVTNSQNQNCGKITEIDYNARKITISNSLNQIAALSIIYGNKNLKFEGNKIRDYYANIKLSKSGITEQHEINAINVELKESK